jgi:hypothetical protein
MPGDEKRGPGWQKAVMERREARRSGNGSSLNDRMRFSALRPPHSYRASGLPDFAKRK